MGKLDDRVEIFLFVGQELFLGDFKPSFVRFLLINAVVKRAIGSRKHGIESRAEPRIEPAFQLQE